MITQTTSRYYNYFSHQTVRVDNTFTRTDANVRPVTLYSNILQVIVKYRNSRKAKMYGTHEIKADYAVVTTPAPITAGIEFEPQIDYHQWLASKMLTYATPVKVFLVFKDRFWNESYVGRVGAPIFQQASNTLYSYDKLWFPLNQPKDGTTMIYSLISFSFISLLQHIKENLLIPDYGFPRSPKL